jgi:hypothetical protein
MNVIIKNYTYMYRGGRNIVMASICDETGKVLRNDQLSNLLFICQKEGHTVVNAQEVLNEIVLKHGFTA